MIATPFARRHRCAHSQQATVARIATTFVVVGLAFLAGASRAWGPTGHRTVAKIAENHLTAAARFAVANLLAPDTLIEAASWADEIRSDEAWTHSGAWHYLNIADGVEYVARRRPPQEDPRNIIEAIEHFELVLGDAAAPAPEREVALRWLVHLIGDLHQPLHVGRAEDRGGNTLEAIWHGRRTNMHRLWDSNMIDQTRLSYSELAASVDSVDSATPTQIDVWQSTSVLDWMNESRALRDRASTPPAANPSGSYRYSYENFGLVRERLHQAGVRLAGRLNALLDAEPLAWEQMTEGLHWVRNSAEYKGLVYQVYRNASRELQRRANAGELPAAGTWAVALDGDETVLDNSLYQKEERNRFSPLTWDEWCERAEAPALPGVVAFLELVRRLQGKIAIVSNRSIAVQAATERNLRQEGVPFDVVLLRDGDGEKEPRWQKVEAGTTGAGLPALEIILYFGDNISDFPDLDQSQYAESAEGYSDFGSRFFLLPNPVYGSFTANSRN